jgi:hypothetical protein
MTVNSATATKVVTALREAANCASDTQDMKTAKVNTFLSFLASPSPAAVTVFQAFPLVKVLWESTHTGMTDTPGHQKARVNLLVSAITGTTVHATTQQAQQVLYYLLKVYESDSDTAVAQANYVNKLIAAIEAV